MEIHPDMAHFSGPRAAYRSPVLSKPIVLTHYRFKGHNICHDMKRCGVKFKAAAKFQAIYNIGYVIEYRTGWTGVMQAALQTEHLIFLN